MNVRERFRRAPYYHLIKKLIICNIPLSESEITFEDSFDVWLIWGLTILYLYNSYFNCIICIQFILVL